MSDTKRDDYGSPEGFIDRCAFDREFGPSRADLAPTLPSADYVAGPWKSPKTDYEAIARMAADGDADPINTAKMNYPHLFHPEMEKCWCNEMYGPDPHCKTCGGFGEVEAYVSPGEKSARIAELETALVARPDQPAADTRVVPLDRLQEWHDLLCDVRGDTTADDDEIRQAANTIRAIINGEPGK